jgi:hypothetical protein
MVCPPGDLYDDDGGGPMKSTQYLLFWERDLCNLENSVQNALDDGFEPFGSPTPIFDPTLQVFYFMQAVIKPGSNHDDRTN